MPPLLSSPIGVQVITKHLWNGFARHAKSDSHPVIGIAQLMWLFPKLLGLALWLAFERDAFAVARASAYSCILTFFPALVVLGSVLATSRRFEVYIREISTVLGRILPAGSKTAIEYLRSRSHRPVTFLTTTCVLSKWTASGVVISWMQGFRNAYHLPKTWGLVKERAIAGSLVILARIPLTFATILVAFGSQIEARILFHIGYGLASFILLPWNATR